MTPVERRSTINRVRQRLKHRPRTVDYHQIAARSELSHGWIKAFSRSQYHQPNIEMVLMLERTLKLFEAELNA